MKRALCCVLTSLVNTNGPVSNFLLVKGFFLNSGSGNSQHNTILPALSHCSQLTAFSFCGNPISMVALETLLRHTVRLSKLSLELYPVPPGCYAQGVLH
ncbi:PRAME family member 12-like [Carlito syrichta]|uniref:PRAME family member 12-like n=1 Tax=Carlito syrichta TaxID=1868482 RepID=A0A3Q0DCB6_CARSF|nr:PRAME family member 12-like [Carlito syrichta]